MGSHNTHRMMMEAFSRIPFKSNSCIFSLEYQRTHCRLGLKFINVWHNVEIIVWSVVALSFNPISFVNSVRLCLFCKVYVLQHGNLAEDGWWEQSVPHKWSSSYGFHSLSNSFGTHEKSPVMEPIAPTLKLVGHFQLSPSRDRALHSEAHA